MNSNQITEQFAACINPDAVRAVFRKLAFVCHPDCGGTKQAFVALHEAYTRRLEAMHGQTFFFKSGKTTKAGKTASYEKEFKYSATDESEFTAKVDRVISMLTAEFVIDLRGNWIWLVNVPLSHHTFIKNVLGFKYKAEANEFYWHPTGQKMRRNPNYRRRTTDEIRAAHGSEIYRGARQTLQ